MKRFSVLLFLLLIVFSVSACSQSQYSVLDWAQGHQAPEPVMTSLSANKGAGAFIVRGDDGKVYMAVSAGEVHQLDQHLRLLRTETDNSTKVMTFTFERYVPKMGQPGTTISSYDWFRIVKFNKISAPSIKVVVKDEQGVQQAQYALEVPK